MRRPLAICWRISALGLRRPRSIWLRYGLDTPACWDSCRSEILACSRCSLMYSPMDAILRCYLPVLVNANNSKHLDQAISKPRWSLSGAVVCRDREEFPCLSDGHRRPLGKGSELRGALDKLGVAGHRAAAGEGDGVLH